MRLENIISKPRHHISVSYHPQTESLWTYLKPKGRYCINPELLQEALQIQEELKSYFEHHDMRPKTSVKYFVSASKSEGVYSYGGDLNLFADLIESRNIELLTLYAESCVKLVYNQATNLQLPLTSVSVIQGTALGGGFEGALSGSILIAEKGVKMGFPEIRFNLFPGMGAYSLIARKTDVQTADEIISSGEVYTSESLYNKGIIDILANNGDGVDTAHQFFNKHKRLFNGHQALLSVKHRYQPIDYDELMDITQIWVDAALRLNSKDLKMMRKLVSMQNSKTEAHPNHLNTDANTNSAQIA